MAAHTLFTLGYEKRTLPEFISLLERAGIAVLVDVREVAWSHKPGFSKTTLRTALENAGIEYVHAAFAGNPKRFRSAAASPEECLALYASYLDQSARILADFELLIGEIIRSGRRACIICFERNADDCHRGVLAARWQRGGKRRVEHLATARQ
jgi:uncharacterized protein (DUF488 family)